MTFIYLFQTKKTAKHKNVTKNLTNVRNWWTSVVRDERGLLCRVKVMGRWSQKIRISFCNWGYMPTNIQCPDCGWGWEAVHWKSLRTRDQLNILRFLSYLLTWLESTRKMSVRLIVWAAVWKDAVGWLDTSSEGRESLHPIMRKADGGSVLPEGQINK